MSGGACLGRGAGAPESVSVGLGSGAEAAAQVNGAVRWANGAVIPENDAGGGWESDAGLRGDKENMLLHYCRLGRHVCSHCCFCH